MPDGMFSSRMKRFTYQNHYGGNPFCKGAEKYQEVEYMKAIPNTYVRKMAVFLQVWCFHVILKNNGPLQLDY